MPKTSIFKTRVGTELLMGKVVKLSNIGINRIPCAQVRCSMNEFNIYLKKYFARSFEFWALDKQSKGSLGDMVLIRRIGVDERPTTNVAHAIDRVVFKYGNILDPVTGRRVIKDEFSDEIELRKKLVAEIIDTPLEQDALLFDERRGIQQEILAEKRAALEGDKADVEKQMESEDLSKERFVRVHSYLEERAAQVADLLQVVDNSNLVSGEVTKGPRTAAQRLPRHMRRRAMAYEVRRFPKGLRNFAAPFLALSKHRKKPPSRFFRRRSRNLLLNYIRRQRKMVWLETHIWHAKRFHVIDRWGYRLPDRSFQRNFRPCYRDSVRHCTIRDKSYLSCILISHNNQEELIALLNPMCAGATSPTFAFKSGLNGICEVSTHLYHPAQYPNGYIGPARFHWSKEGQTFSLALWVHPSCRDEVFDVIKELLGLVDEQHSNGEEQLESFILRTVEEWRLCKMRVRTDCWSGKNGIKVQDLRDQLVRFRLYGPLALTIVADALKLVEDEKAPQFSENHIEWRESASLLSPGNAVDGSVFSLLVEDPRISRPSVKEVPRSDHDEPIMERRVVPRATFWDKEERLKALGDRMSDSELNKLKGKCLGQIKETEAKIPVFVVIRNGGTGRGDTLSGCEFIVPCGFGMDFWVALQLRTARASGWRDELAAHLEASRLCYPTDVVDSKAGKDEINRMQNELEMKYDKRPHNRRVQYWKKMSVKYPFSFEYMELFNDWLKVKGKELATQPFVLRDRRLLLSLSKWMDGKGKLQDGALSEYFGGLVPVELQCLARGRPKRYGLVCLPTAEDMLKIKNRHKTGPVMIIQPPRDAKEGAESTSMEVEELIKKNDIWKDTVSLDQSAREKPIPLKDLFPDTKVVDKSLKRRLLNRKKRENKKRKLENREERLKELNAEKDEKDRITYRESANRLIIGRIVRGDFSFYAASGRALSYVPFCVLEEVRKTGGMVLLRNSTSRYYHPAKLKILTNQLEL
ncbi:unnamed protein product [Cylicocyclus nassatus]|uniref:Uncharacterized protein n=1 Tax=Cylicocyclus nassatus TaxID=53992 RepID=A0AA36GTM7_CYLNA|nr:unnamed protein product [Cylicocyclus nassatus]